jgi:hypothetical protein
MIELTVADSLTTVLLAALAAMGLAGGGPTVDGHLAWRPSLWWTIFYFSGMVLLAWFAG